MIYQLTWSDCDIFPVVYSGITSLVLNLADKISFVLLDYRYQTLLGKELEFKDWPIWIISSADPQGVLCCKIGLHSWQSCCLQFTNPPIFKAKLVW